MHTRHEIAQFQAGDNFWMRNVQKEIEVKLHENLSEKLGMFNNLRASEMMRKKFNFSERKCGMWQTSNEIKFSGSAAVAWLLFRWVGEENIKNIKK